MFGDDSFMGIEDLFNQLARGRNFSSRENGSHSQILLGTVESKKETILIFDLSGKKINSLEIKDDIEINEYGERVHGHQKALAIRFENNEVIKYSLPKNLAKRKMSHTFSNGILEVSLRK